MLPLLPSLGRSGLPAAVGRAKKLCLTAAGGLCGGRGGVLILLLGVGVAARSGSSPAWHEQIVRCDVEVEVTQDLPGGVCTLSVAEMSMLLIRISQ